jgi:signal transduction histidine kinase
MRCAYPPYNSTFAKPFKNFPAGTIHQRDTSQGSQQLTTQNLSLALAPRAMPAQIEVQNGNPFAHSTILIVDDEPTNIDLLEMLLRRAGYQRLISTNDSDEVLGLYRQHRPDLVLLDVCMPILDGFDVMRALHETFPGEEINIAMVTALNDKDVRRRALESGVRDFINKPLDRTETLIRIRNLLQAHHLTQRMIAQNEHLAEANAALERLNHSMSELVSIVSHELRTPLTSIKSFAEILRDEGDKLDSDSKRHFLDIIDDESERLSRLISDLLDLQKIQSGKMTWRTELVDLQQVLRDTVEFFGPAYRDKGLSLEIDSQLQSAHVLADGDKLRQVFSNLLSNALKFTQNGGVKVSLQSAGCWAEVVLVSADVDAGRALDAIVTGLGAHLRCFDSAEEGMTHLDRCGGNVDLLIVDIGSGDEVEFIQKIRERFPALPVVSLMGGNGPADARSLKSTIVKPNLDQDRGAIELLIADMIGLTPKLPMIEITIRDSGMGIPEDQLSRVFERFYQVDSSQIREQRGTGLGLTICQQIVRHYHGKIWVESRLGEGSTFHLLLPEMREQKKKLGEILVEKGLLTKEQLTDALKDQA